VQADYIDDLIARIEAAGAVALTFYSPMMDAGSLDRMLRPGGTALADVLINTQIMLMPEMRRAEFERLGIPVLQAMTYRRGDTAHWQANPQGVPLMDVPFYLAQAELAGVTDIQVASASGAGDAPIAAIPPQADAVVGKALRLVALQRKQNADKRLSVFFWNYPAGEKNLSASFLNVPRSLQTTLAALRAQGYDTEVPSEPELIAKLQRLLAPAYRAGELEPLLREGLAATVPVARYRAWLKGQPAAVQTALRERWGEPEASSMVLNQGGQAMFVVPRLMLGKIAVLPQPPRGEKWEPKEKAIYHSPSAWPSHYYLAAYLWAREQQASDALVHFGTHGSQEWLPGKERGLSVSDPGMLAVGDLPVAYPYIADNIGEAQQAKRRGRAVIISHQTPPFKPAGLHQALTHLHDLLHAWLAQDEGVVKDKIKADLLAAAAKERIDRDMGWTPERARAEFPAFVDALHNQLHELAETAQPLGLHTLGRAPEAQHRLATVLLMLGRPFWEAAALHAGIPAADVDEALLADYDKLPGTVPYQLLQRHVVQGESTQGLSAPLREALDKARTWYAAIGADQELPALLTVLAGRHLPTSYGGDPIKNPDAYPTGRNLYGFDPSRVPTKQAWAAGKEAAEQLIAEHRRLTGQQPKKLAVSLWSVETMRHQGLLEAQALWLLGTEPVWDEGGRVTGVKLVPRKELGRERVDVVLSATGLYRDHFPNTMKILAQAAQLAARATGDGDEANPVAAHTRAIAARLRAQGLPDQAAQAAAETRIYSSESGKYGTGLDDATLATDTWKGKQEGDRKLAQLYLSRMQFAYGADESTWGSLQGGGLKGKDGQPLNLYAEHLRGTEGAVLSRTSNTYGMLTTDDPFQYLGGIGLAVRHLDGKAPQLYISNLRGAGSGRVEGAAQFLAKELATRQFHPGYIKGLMQEGYAGTLQVLDATNNFWGWTAVAREIVRDDQWQEMVDVYVRDKHQLGLKQWFEAHNPHALAQNIERMLEAARQGYWQADAATVAELKDRWRDLAQRFDVRTDNAAFERFVGAGQGTAGFGLNLGHSSADPAAAAAQSAAAPPPAAEAAPAAPPPPPPPISGMRLEQVADKPPAPDANTWQTLWVALVLGAFMLGGGWWQRRYSFQAKLASSA
jgi:cobaltochelatase CobN